MKSYTLNICVQAGSGFVVPDSFPLVLVGDVVRILRGRKISPLCGALSALSDLVVLLKEASKDMRKGAVTCVFSAQFSTRVRIASFTLGSFWL